MHIYTIYVYIYTHISVCLSVRPLIHPSIFQSVPTAPDVPGRSARAAAPRRRQRLRCESCGSPRAARWGKELVSLNSGHQNTWNSGDTVGCSTLVMLKLLKPYRIKHLATAAGFLQ